MQPLPAVVCAPSKHARKVQKLVEHCRDLDGTEITVIPIDEAEDKAFAESNPGNTFAKMQARSLRMEALHFKGKSFIHLEPDSIPIKAGWATTLTEEHRALGKPFMLSSDSHPPGDLVGGIGVYGPDTSFLIPVLVEKHGWDMWMLQNIRELISFTPLIQHKYGIYDQEGINKVRDIRFPEDSRLLRHNTVIFHRDPAQTLIPRNAETVRFAHSGCIGDTVAALSTIRQLGGGHLVMTQKYNKRILRGERYEFLRPLLESQPYIKSVAWEEEPKDIDHDFTDFRTIYRCDTSLAQTQARFIGVDPLDESPWLTVEPDPRTKGRIVVSRSPRYQNNEFPWRQVAKRAMNRLFFIGLPEEQQDLEARIGMRLPSAPCNSALEVAQLIAGADMFIGNQSSPFWIAAGLGKKLVQETSIFNPDSKVIRPNAIYWQSQQQTKQVLGFLAQT